MFALIGVVFTDLMVNHGLPWQLVPVIAVGMGLVLGAIHGFLITKLKMQPFVVTLFDLLIYLAVARWYMNDTTIGFGSGDEYETMMWPALGSSVGVHHTFRN